MTASLNLQPNFGRPGERYRHPYVPGDAFYERLIGAQDGPLAQLLDDAAHDVARSGEADALVAAGLREDDRQRR